MVVAGWSRRRWFVAGVSGVVIALLVAVPTAVLPNRVFGRSVDVTWWSYPTLVMTGILSGLLVATYVRAPQSGVSAARDVDRASKLGVAGAVISFFAVGCPVCNKVVLLALGASGAVTWFAPLQPIMAIASLILMAVALRIRLRGEMSCVVKPALLASGATQPTQARTVEEVDTSGGMP